MSNDAAVPWDLVRELSRLMMIDDDIKDMSRFLAIPNATVDKIKTLHEAHIKRRKEVKNK